MGFSPCLSLTRKILLSLLSNKQNANIPLINCNVLSKPNFEIDSTSVSVSEEPRQNILFSQSNNLLIFKWLYISPLKVMVNLLYLICLGLKYLFEKQDNRSKYL